MLHIKRRILLIVAITAVLSFGTISTLAQCSNKNTAFTSGEVLNYKMYFNWKFIWVNAGTATLSTKDTQWSGKTVYRCHLITKSSSKVDKYFMMRDTLEGILTHDLIPLYYKKGANEGGRYYRDQVWYSYANGKTFLKQEYQSRDGKITNKKHETNRCVYDMINMMQRARSFDASSFKKGERMKFPMADGKDVEDIILIYRGKENFKMKSTGITYRCLTFSLVEKENGKHEKEIITFYITDDDNHLPVRLDMYLRFGTAKAYLTEANGLLHECTSIVR